MINKINFKKPKYVIPALVLVPLLFIAYQVAGVLEYEVEEETVIQTEGEVNSSMPEANMENLELKSKYKNMIDDYSRIKDYSAVQNIEMETEQKDEDVQSLYSEKEIALLDSINQANAEQMKELEKLRETVNQASNKPSNETSPIEQSTAELQKHLEAMQRIARGEEIKTPEQIAKEEALKELREEQKREEEERMKAAAPNEVLKADGLNKKHFNTIGKEDPEDLLIKAMLDEKVKVVDGSRIRIRLLDDVIINDVLLKKGTYLYALVTGFGAQRVKAKISSILVGNKHIKVALNIYDNDGIEGFYVPSSAFRDLAKEAGSQALGQNITMNSNSQEQNLETFAFQTLQGIYQSTTSAISNNIKKNKAKLKYNTVVYLINEQ